VLLEFTARQTGEAFGRKTCDVGDLDGDGHGDVLVGAPANDEAGQDAGRAYVFSGRDGSELLVLTGEKAGDRYGSSGAGIRTGEHLFLVVGAPGAGPVGTGRTYVYKDRSGNPAFVIDADETGSSLGGMFVSVVGDAVVRPLMDAWDAGGGAERWDVSSLFSIGSGGAPLSPSMKLRMAEAFPEVIIADGFGSSETGIQA